MTITCFVGLGNPGTQYQDTRHNLGFWFIERLAKDQAVSLSACAQAKGRSARFTLKGQRVHLFCPGTYMNHNGGAVSAYCRYHKIAPEAVMVVHDDLDFAPGVVRLKRGGGSGGHNGLKDVTSALGSPDYARLRFGIGRSPNPDNTSDYVLGRPSRSDRAAIDDAIERVLLDVLALGEGTSWDQVVARIHGPDVL